MSFKLFSFIAYAKKWIFYYGAYLINNICFMPSHFIRTYVDRRSQSNNFVLINGKKIRVRRDDVFT